MAEETRNAVKAEPFVSFPLWGLIRALNDHTAQHTITGKCPDDWYHRLLTDKITACHVPTTSERVQ